MIIHGIIFAVPGFLVLEYQLVPLEGYKFHGWAISSMYCFPELCLVRMNSHNAWSHGVYVELKNTSVIIN